mmetsp:Transcript_32257/g.84393  ORF Transcript_32257/g.84393 Transcript_32257/m.84393 type:complete len:212 (+) Transcript_32257:1367-2002(+)
MCSRPAALAPSVFLQIMPDKRVPDRIMTRVSCAVIHLASLSSSLLSCFECVRSRLTRSSRSKEKSCFPVHNCFGFTMAGTGIFPSQLGTNMRRCMSSALSMNESLKVKSLADRSVSCTIPITGRFDCGVRIFSSTFIISSISARVSSDCGMCMFISSPSKSALYGVVHDRFMRKVDHGRILTRCPIIDILCKVGWRLNTITSLSRICRSTT